MEHRPILYASAPRALRARLLPVVVASCARRRHGHPTRGLIQLASMTALVDFRGAQPPKAQEAKRWRQKSPGTARAAKKFFGCRSSMRVTRRIREHNSRRHARRAPMRGAPRPPVRITTKWPATTHPTSQPHHAPSHIDAAAHTRT